MPATRLVSGIKLAQYSKALFSLTLLVYMMAHGIICSTCTRQCGMYILLPTFCIKWRFLIGSVTETSEALSVEDWNNHSP